VNITSELPAIRVNAIHLQQIFQSLVSNAVKHNDKNQPVIEIGYAENKLF